MPFNSYEIPDCHTCVTEYHDPDDGINAPCHICPVPKRRLNKRNKVYWKLWKLLDARDRNHVYTMGGMVFGHIPNDAIIRILKLYGKYNSYNYEKLVYIESRMYPFLREMFNATQNKALKKNK